MPGHPKGVDPTMQQSTFTVVRDLVVEHLGIDIEEVTPQSSLLDDLGADSLDAIELSMALEEEFSIELTDEDVESATTVDSLVTLIDRKVAERGRLRQSQR